MGKFLVNFVAAGLMVSAVAQADMPLSEQDKDQIIGEYSYVGPFSDTTINVALEFYKNDDNELQAGGKVRAKVMPEGQWITVELHTFRLLSAKEWAEEWKVTELSGKRCDEDRLCVVAVDKSTLNGEEYGFAMRLMQFESDFSSFQSYVSFHNAVRQKRTQHIPKLIKRALFNSSIIFIICVLISIGEKIDLEVRTSQTP